MFFDIVEFMVCDSEGFAKSLVKYELIPRAVSLEEISLELKRGIDERNNDSAFKHMIRGNIIKTPFAYSDWPLSFPGSDLWLLFYNSDDRETEAIALYHYSDSKGFKGDCPDSPLNDFSEKGIYVVSHGGSKGFYRSPRLAVAAFFQAMDNFRKD